MKLDLQEKHCVQACSDCNLTLDECRQIGSIKTREIAEIVRCKNCRYWQDNNNGYPHPECRWSHEETPDPDDFCSFASDIRQIPENNMNGNEDDKRCCLCLHYEDGRCDYFDHDVDVSDYCSRFHDKPYQPSCEEMNEAFGKDG